MTQREVQADDAVIRSMVLQGYTYTQIGEHLGRSKNSVVGRAHRISGIPKRPSPIIRTGEPRQPRAPRAKPITLQPGRPQPPPVLLPEPAAFAPASRLCCWPTWGHKERTTHKYCGQPGIPGRPYCPTHHVIAYQSSAEKRDAA